MQAKYSAAVSPAVHSE